MIKSLPYEIKDKLLPERQQWLNNAVNCIQNVYNRMKSDFKSLRMQLI